MANQQVSASFLIVKVSFLLQHEKPKEMYADLRSCLLIIYSFTGPTMHMTAPSVPTNIYLWRVLRIECGRLPS